MNLLCIIVCVRPRIYCWGDTPIKCPKGHIMTKEFRWPVDITGKRYAVLVCDGCDCHFDPAEGFLHCKACEFDFHCNQKVKNTKMQISTSLWTCKNSFLLSFTLIFFLNIILLVDFWWLPPHFYRNFQTTKMRKN